MILNGWITPDGEILQCGFCCHINIAERIINSLPPDEKWERLEKADMSDCKVLFDMGYVRFFSEYEAYEFPRLNSDPEIKFEHTREEIPDKILFAQARLLKQLR